MRRAWALLLVAGCGGRIDTRQAESKVKEIAEASTHSKVKSVSCPPARQENGVKLECEVEFVEGGHGTMRVTITNADNGVFEPAWVTPLVSKKHLSEVLSQHEADSFDCGTGVVFAPVDIPCQSAAKPLVISIDDNGDAHW